MTSRALRFQLRQVSIDSPRYGDEGAIDVTSLVAEINIFESLQSPFLTGDLMIVDTSGVSNLIQAQGQETVRIEFYTEETAPVIREFVIYGVRRHSKQENTTSSLYTYSLIEKHGFFSYFQRLRKSYKGEIGSIIYSIYSRELFNKTDEEETQGDDVEVNLLSVDNFETAHQSIKVIAPNVTPMAFCTWLNKRATTPLGEPFFLYSTVRSGPQFRSLASLMGAPVVNLDKPYRFSQVYTNSGFENEAFRIIDLDIPPNDNSIALARAGAFSTLYQGIDPFYKTNQQALYQSRFDQQNYFDRKAEAGRLYPPVNGIQFYDENLYDDEFTIGPREERLRDIPSQIHSEIVTSNMFDNSKAYHEEPTADDHLHKMRRRSDLAFMDKRRIVATVPGYHMFNTKDHSSVGRVFDIRIPSDKTLVQSDPDNVYDDKFTEPMAGYFLATKVRHCFKPVEQIYVATGEFSKIATS